MVIEIADPRWNSWWDGKILRVQIRESHMHDSDIQRNCMSACEYIRCDRWYLLNINNQVSNAGLFYRIFYPQGVRVSHHFVYLQLCIICITSLLAYMYHFVMCIMHSCRYYTVYIIYDIDLVPNLERRGHCTYYRYVHFHRCWVKRQDDVTGQ